MNSVQDVLKKKMDAYAHLVYRITKNFPKEEMYGITSQLRRASLSVILNYIEGYARFRTKVFKQFLQISYGSLKESKYLLYFSFREQYFSKAEYDEAIALADEIGAMLYSTLNKVQH